ncbi:MAG TPA: hypothetical protein VF916_09780, partial [Ktedonobacterales bacterium]
MPPLRLRLMARAHALVPTAPHHGRRAHAGRPYTGGSYGAAGPLYRRFLWDQRRILVREPLKKRTMSSKSTAPRTAT